MRAWILVTALLAVLATPFGLSGCLFDDEEEQEALARSLAGAEGKDNAAGCTEQDDGAWFYCASSGDPTSGWSSQYIVFLADECWGAVRMKYMPEPGRFGRAGRLAGCIDSGEEGESIEGPGEPGEKLAPEVPRLVSLLRAEAAE
jgi:hypothetical protein